MRVRVTSICTIPDEELEEMGIDFWDKHAIEEYFYSQGAEDTYHDHGESFEILRD